MEIQIIKSSEHAIEFASKITSKGILELNRRIKLENRRVNKLRRFKKRGEAVEHAITAQLYREVIEEFHKLYKINLIKGIIKF